MALISLTPLDLPAFGQGKTFGCTPMGFHLGHNGILLLIVGRGQNHHHIPAFHQGFSLHGGMILHHLVKTVHDLNAAVCKAKLTPPETDGHLYLIAVLEETGTGLGLNLHIMGIDGGGKANLL